MVTEHGQTFEILSQHDIEKNAEAAIKKIRKLAIKTFKEPFDSIENANRTTALFNENVLEIAGMTDAIDQIPLSITGPGILFPDMNITSDENHYEITRTENEILQLYGGFDSLNGTFEGVNVLRDESHKDGIMLEAFMVMIYRDEGVIMTTSYGFNAVEMPLIRRSMVKCDSLAEITVPPLEMIRARKDAVKSLSVQGLAKSNYMHALKKFEQALYTEDTQRFSNLKNLTYLHTVGRLGAVHAEKGTQENESILKSITETIGKGRQVSIKSSDIYYFDKGGSVESSENTVSVRGRFVDACDQIKNTKSNSILAVIEGTTDENPESTFYYVPLAKIESFAF